MVLVNLQIVEELWDPIPRPVLHMIYVYVNPRVGEMSLVLCFGIICLYKDHSTKQNTTVAGCYTIATSGQSELAEW